MQEDTPDELPPSKPSLFDILQQYVSDWLRKHGLPMFLFALASWYFWSENQEIKAQIRACNDSLIETYRVNQVQLLDVINNNTRALQEYKAD